MTRTVLVLDQFHGPSPYQLQREPMRFDALVEEAQQHPERFGSWRKPEVLEASDDYRPAMCTTVYAADEQGMAQVWRCRWDSSG